MSGHHSDQLTLMELARATYTRLNAFKSLWPAILVCPRLRPFLGHKIFGAKLGESDKQGLIAFSTLNIHETLYQR